MSLLPEGPALYAFVLASLVLAVTPGPGVLYIVTRSLTEGRSAGLASVAGVALGNFGNAVGAATGLAAVFSTSALAFDIIRWLGAAWLVFLGVQALRDTTPAHNGIRSAIRSPQRRVLRDGCLVALLNPKTALFFAAFLPQFVTNETSHTLQPVVLGALFVAIAAATDALYASFAGLFAPVMSRARTALPMTRFLKGGAYFGLGLFTAVSGVRSER